MPQMRPRPLGKFIPVESVKFYRMFLQEAIGEICRTSFNVNIGRFLKLVLCNPS